MREEPDHKTHFETAFRPYGGEARPLRVRLVQTGNARPYVVLDEPDSNLLTTLTGGDAETLARALEEAARLATRVGFDPEEQH